MPNQWTVRCTVCHHNWKTMDEPEKQGICSNCDDGDVSIFSITVKNIPGLLLGEKRYTVESILRCSVENSTAPDFHFALKGDIVGMAEQANLLLDLGIEFGMNDVYPTVRNAGTYRRVIRHLWENDLCWGIYQTEIMMYGIATKHAINQRRKAA